MSSSAILDSSPVRGASQAESSSRTRRPLKRSASTASLLTPPRTVEQKRYLSRHSDQDEDPETDSDGERVVFTRPSKRVLFAGRKRQRTERLDAVLASLSGEDDENPFWDGEEGACEDEGIERESPPPPVLSHGKVLMSPPPSNRRPVTVRQIEPPRTPEKKTGSNMPIRDTGNNPFLDDDTSPMSIVEGPSEPETPVDHSGEKPTISYVFRGVKTTFANPVYNLPDSVREQALLPPEHPDFSPDPLCPPKLLFPQAHRKRTRSQTPPISTPLTKHRRLRPHEHYSDGGDEWDDEEEAPLQITPPKKFVQQRS